MLRIEEKKQKGACGWRFFTVLWRGEWESSGFLEGLVVVVAMVYFLSFYLSFCFFSYFAFVLVVFFFTLLPSFASEVKLNLKILMIEYCE